MLYVNYNLKKKKSSVRRSDDLPVCVVLVTLRLSNEYIFSMTVENYKS